MINCFLERLKYKVLALIAFTMLLSACEGINIRVFPQSAQSRQDMKVVLEYEPTRCVPFISCHFEWSILSSSRWELNSAESVIIEPGLVTDRYSEFSNIYPSRLLSIGGYILKSIEVKQGAYSYYITACDAENHRVDDAMEQRLKSRYKNNLYSFAIYKDTVMKKVDAENTILGKVPLRLLHDTEGYPRAAISLPLTFQQIGSIDLHFLNGEDLTDGIFFSDKYPDVSNRIHQHVLNNEAILECNKDGECTVKFDWNLKKDR